MATNDEVATTLRMLAEAADTPLATHDCRTLAEALESDDQLAHPTTQAELMDDIKENHPEITIESTKNHPKGDDGVYVPDISRDEFRETYPNWELIDNPENGREGSVWHNYPVLK